MMSFGPFLNKIQNTITDFQSNYNVIAFHVENCYYVQQDVCVCVCGLDILVLLLLDGCFIRWNGSHFHDTSVNGQNHFEPFKFPVFPLEKAEHNF